MDLSGSAFQHDQLPTPTSIRLLEILPVDGEDIRCSMTIVDMEENPEYHALSYTWCNPITVQEKPQEPTIKKEMDKELELKKEKPSPNPQSFLDLDALVYETSHPYQPYEKVDKSAERSHPIYCNEKVIYVTQNLIDVLRLLRRIMIRDTKSPAHATTVNKLLFGYHPVRKFWIDSICINQSDMTEVKAQISIMHHVFGNALSVIGWLGPEDATSRRGADTLYRMFLQLIDPHKQWNASRGNLYSFDNMDQTTYAALFALLQRLWFRRTWIVQEAVLARKLVLLCGGVFITWEVLTVVLQYMVDNRLDGELSDMGLQMMRGDPVMKFTRKQIRAGAHAIGFSTVNGREFKEKLDVDPNGSYDFFLGVKEVRRLLDAEEPVTLERLIALSRSTEATDPRDKIFSLMNIVAKSQRLVTPAQGLNVDYSESVQAIYLSTTKNIIKGSGSLNILSQVQDPLLTRVPNLPSWVPDFSVSLQRSLLDHPGQRIYSAAGKHSFGTSIALPFASRIMVQGIKIDEVLDLADSQGCYFIRTAKLVSKLPIWYPSLSDNKQPTSRIEAFWRTLTADHFGNQHPAPLACGIAFSEWVCKDIHLSINFVRSILRMDKIQSTAKDSALSKLKEKLAWVKVLGSSEPEVFYPLGMLRDALKSSAQGLAREIAPSCTTSPEKARFKFIPDRNRFVSYSWMNNQGDGNENDKQEKLITERKNRSKEFLSPFEARIGKTRAQRQMFRTKNNYLGMAPMSTLGADQLWILRGANVPFVLRRQDDNSYQVIGEAYVHGVMDGELLGENVEFEELLLC